MKALLIVVLVTLSAQSVYATESDLCKKLAKIEAAEGRFVGYSFARALRDMGYSTSQVRAVATKVSSESSRYVREAAMKEDVDTMNEVSKSLGCK